MPLGNALVVINVYLTTALYFCIACFEDLLGTWLVRIVLDEGLLLSGLRKFVVDKFLEESW